MNPELTIAQGKLKGTVKVNVDGKQFYSFQGIPYAKPPVNELRFKDPQPAEKWNGCFDATKEGSHCYSRDLFQVDAVTGSEDCLFLNVYSKRLPSSNEPKPNLPVLFWIHGGGFIFGSSRTQEYGPEHLLNEDIVLVTINYRLGMLGFLACEDPSLGVTGNFGMKDMIMALKWVQKNIAQFGGNPDSVTIFGESAGGASVHYLFLSPMAKGLFHKAIAQSGCSLNPWAHAKPNVKEIGEAMDMEGKDERSILEELKKLSVEELFKIQEKANDSMSSLIPRLFAPVVDSQAKESFLPDKPINIMAKGNFNQVPFMTGFNTGEGMCFDLPILPKTEFKVPVPWFLGYKEGTPEFEKIKEKITEFYFKGAQLSSSPNRHNLLSDLQFIFGIYMVVLSQYHRSKAQTYVYYMSLETKLNLYKVFLKINGPGVCHADDLGYLFKTAGTPEIEPNSEEDIGMRRFVRLWTNFAKYGNPTHVTDDLIKVKWNPVTDSNVQYLNIDKELKMQAKPEEQRMAFWMDLLAHSPNAQYVKLMGQ